MSRILSPQIDVVFKKMFADKNNIGLLRNLLSKILGIPENDLQDIVVLNPELLPEEVDQKFSRLDIRAKVSGKNVNIEMQVQNKDDYKSRALFYWAQLFTSDFKSGQLYSQIPETITINIINFKLFKKQGFHSVFRVSDVETGEMLSDKFRIDFVELPKVSFSDDVRDELIQWMQFLKVKSEEDLKMLESRNISPTLKEAVETLERMSLDRDLRIVAEAREKAIRDELSALATAELRGEKIGIEKGRVEGEKLV